MRPPTPKQREALRLIAEGRMIPSLRREEDGWHARWRASGPVDNPWVDSYVRAAAVTPLSADAEDQRHDTLHDAWMLALRSDTGLVRWDDAECAAFAAELDGWGGAAEADAASRAALAFRFEAEGEGSSARFSVRCAAPTGRRALRALGQAAQVFGSLRDLKRDGDGLSVSLSRAEAESFLRSGARDLAAAGYCVEGVDLAASVSVGVDLGAPAGADGARRGAEGQGEVAARLVVRVAGEVVDAAEVRFLLEQKSTFVFFRDRWIEVDRNILREALRALEKSAPRTLSPNAALGFALGVGAVGRLAVDEARAHGWIRGLVHELRERVAAAGATPSGPAPSAPIPGLAAELRPYQRRGVSWIRFLADHGFGALLADDMGLGKTVQTIAWILASRASGATEAPFLVVAPLTLLANWRHECARFAPGLRVCVHQGGTRALEEGFRRAAAESDVVLTSYSLLVRDYAIIRRVAWAGLVLDEAQAVKNPDTQVARAVRALGAPRRLALTGTPVENTVADVWSLEEFLNPGFLGERKSFADRFVKPISQDERSAAAKRLRRALEPFVLRRLKSDGEIAGELGEKREIKEYCQLSPAQRRDYEAALADYRASDRRQGDVFALITRLKLVCDGLGGGDVDAESGAPAAPLSGGKADRLVELLESIFDAGESALVFTQYAKVGSRLRALLEKRFSRTFPFLHGALSAARREGEIARFNAGGPSAFILSLKAGGYGLNLVKATHVIHFDRWWNPAVEAQATDRTHRIGQTRTVFVHAFVAEGTLEERVDEILERKARIAGTLVASGEAFLRQLAPDELERALALA